MAVKVCVTLLMVLGCTRAATEQDAIGFPQSIEDETLKNSNNRVPLDTSTCPVGELLYPGDQKSDWICDCRPAYVYNPKTDKCHEIYRQGPCADGQYMVLQHGNAIPICAVNPCKKDGVVPFKKGCEPLNSDKICNTTPNRKLLVVGVNATTLALECIQAEITNRFSEDDEECPKWSRREKNGICKKILESYQTSN